MLAFGFLLAVFVFTRSEEAGPALLGLPQRLAAVGRTSCLVWLGEHPMCPWQPLSTWHPQPLSPFTIFWLG